ncbi:MAG: 16S rRNA (guanine(527)-N(7))-methyltransferase RsmG [Muribaculaceae bacterium]|nr:16S rRNA (guanine(527)-N(7))-methyltransferase RsmG [Muribaculaceae bacterium]
MEDFKYNGCVDLRQYSLDYFLEDLKDFGITLSEAQLCQFMRYYELLVEWNQKMNLTAITDFDEVCKKHFIDSLSLVRVDCYNFNINAPMSVIDVGTGAGFPGIPLKIAFSDLEITLLDSLQKRVTFLQTVIDELSLDGIKVIHGRAEDFAKRDKLREKYDLCVSRAVANLTVLSEYCLPYVKVGGNFISYKSEKITEEMKDAKKAIITLGGRVEKQVEFMIPHSDIYRNLFIIYKEKSTPAIYPRKAGLPAKKPLK